MAIIKFDPTAGFLKEYGTSNNAGAIGVVILNEFGLPVNKTPLGSYLAQFIKVRSASAPTANGLLWVMANAATRIIKIRRITLNCSFDGLATAGNTQAYEFVRITSTAAASWATGIELIKEKKKTTYSASALQTVRHNTGNVITVPAGVTVPTEGFCTFGVPRSVSGAVVSYMWEFGDEATNHDSLELASYEGLGIVTRVAGVAGDLISGCIEWDETT